MGMPGRRDGYALLRQFPAEDLSSIHPLESLSAEKNKGRMDLILDWTSVDTGTDIRFQQPPRIASIFSSSGSSFGEGSLSGEYYHPPSISIAGNDPDFSSSLQDEELNNGAAREDDLRRKAGEGVHDISTSKSWAQQTEELYQLQLALALRLSSEATCANDPNFLDPLPDDSTPRSSGVSAESMSHRFWVNGCLSYHDKIPNEFYLIQGLDPSIWILCNDIQEHGRIPSIEILRTVNSSDSLYEVIVVDKWRDPRLKELEAQSVGISRRGSSPKEVVEQVAKLVAAHMGGAASFGEDDLVSRWKDCSDYLKKCLNTIVLPIGSLSIGLCRHRSLLFKALCDKIELPCRIAKGCIYCKRDDASSCLVRVDTDREYVVDLIGKPGSLSLPDSSFNGPSSISISSPLHLSRHKKTITEDFKFLAKQYFLDCQSLNLILKDAPQDFTGQENDVVALKNLDRDVNKMDYANLVSNQVITWSNAHNEDSRLQKMQEISQNSINPDHLEMNREVNKTLALSQLKDDKGKGPKFNNGIELVSNTTTDSLSLNIDDLDIPWIDLDLKEKIGEGSFGIVLRADWHGSDVAVKILMEQDFYPERFNEFLREVAIMKRLRHPNIVLFMGAVTHPPNLSIVTEYLSRGSLYRLLHKSGVKDLLDDRRRLNMAYDVAKGMNYLHRRNPPIVHRDLKSPNLLVDKKYTVKVCDFGLSRLKANTYLSSKSTAGTPEWMAPEVLRDEPSNEKSDVYSFGVILWELVTLQQPWSNLSTAQVVAAVGFKGRRLEIPSDVNPQVVSIIESCWMEESWRRPSFSNIMEMLKPLVKIPTPQPARGNIL